MEQWTVKAFNEWRKHCGYAIQKSIVDLSEEMANFIKLAIFRYIGKHSKTLAFS